MIEKWMKDKRLKAIAAWVLFAILSMTLLNGVFSSLKFHEGTIRILDEQKANAMALDIVLASTSTALTLLPDDMGTPIADELADMTDLVFLIVCVLYLQKFCLTTFSWIACRWLIPIACGMACVNVFVDCANLRKWTRRLLLIAMVLIFVIPTGAGVTQRIYETFDESVKQVFEEAKVIAEEETVEDTEEGNAFLEFFASVKDTVAGLAEDVADVIDMAKSIMNLAVDAIAVLFITACIIPVITTVVFVGLVMKILNVQAPLKKIDGVTNQARGMMKNYRSKLNSEKLDMAEK